MKQSKIHPWRTIKNPAAFKAWQAGRKRFAPPQTPTPWEQGTMVDASALQRATVEAEANRQDYRRKNGFKATQNEL